MPSLNLGPFVVESYSHGWVVGRPDPAVVEGKRTFVLRDTTYTSTPLKAIRTAIKRILREPDGAAGMERGEEAASIMARLVSLESILSRSPELSFLCDQLNAAAEEEREAKRVEASEEAKGGTE